MASILFKILHVPSVQVQLSLENVKKFRSQDVLDGLTDDIDNPSDDVEIAN